MVYQVTLQLICQRTAVYMRQDNRESHLNVHNLKYFKIRSQSRMCKRVYADGHLRNDICTHSSLRFCPFKSIHVSGGTRTHSLRIRSPARYPLRHGDRLAKLRVKCYSVIRLNLICFKTSLTVWKWKLAPWVRIPTHGNDSNAYMDCSLAKLHVLDPSYAGHSR